MATDAGWHPDPHGRYQYRWWDGTSWTSTVAQDGASFDEATAEAGQTTSATASTPTTAQPVPAPTTATAQPVPAAAPAAASAFRSQTLPIIAIVVVAALVVAAVIVLTRGSDEPSRGTAAPGVSALETIGSAGGRVTIAAPGSDATTPITLEVPPGALSSEVALSVATAELPTTDLSELTETEPGVMDALVSHALDDEDSLVHPVYGPFVVAAGGELTGVMIELGPAGLELAEPAELVLPLSQFPFPEGTHPIVLLEGDAGWEVIPDWSIDEAAGTLTISIPHFSRSFIGRIVDNVIANPTATAGRENYRAALETLSQGPIDDVYDSIIAATLCREGVRFNSSSLPSAWELLNYLGFESGWTPSIPLAADRRMEATLRAHFDASNAAGNRTPHDFTFSQLFEMAMGETNNDVFQSLLLVHRVLGFNRNSQPIQGVLENVRGDGGDERGARYHLVGTAIYSFLYEHLRATGQTGIFWPPQPSTTISVEEAWVSGDIRTDTVEYAVDRRGADLGRSLYREFSQAQGGNRSEYLGLICDRVGGTTTTTSSTLPTDIDLGSGEVQVTLQWTGDADMDLHVIDPEGSEIYFSMPTSNSGGTLDHDDIPGCGSGNVDNVENVFWPPRGAPSGRYEVFVHSFRGCDGRSQQAQLSVRVNGRVTLVETVNLTDGQTSSRFSFTLR